MSYCQGARRQKSGVRIFFEVQDKGLKTLKVCKKFLLTTEF